jgi:hypothetical protein
MPRGKKDETVTQKAERLQQEVGILQLALRCMTNGTFQWGEGKNADLTINFETGAKIRKDVRYGVGRSDQWKSPVILREFRDGDGKSTAVVPLTVDQLMRQSAFAVMNSGIDVLETIIRDAKKIDVDPNDEDSGRYVYEWPKADAA